MKRRQTVRRLEIIAVVAVVTVSLVVGFYLALNAGSSALDGKPVPQSVYTLLYQTSRAPYGVSDTASLTSVHALTGQTFSTNGEPILVYVGADYCLYCAFQRWSLIMALMRFGNFTNLEYMHSSVGDGNYATFTFTKSSYQSNYVVFQPYELEDRAGNKITTLPTNYTSAFVQYGKSAFPFLNFANEYYISGAVADPAILGTKNQTQIISSIQAGGTLASQIKQAANLMTAVICKTTGDKPASVCGQDSIVMLTGSLVSYTPPSTSSGSELLLTSASVTGSLDIFIAERDYGGWN
jgi:hypothetical protein